MRCAPFFGGWLLALLTVCCTPAIGLAQSQTQSQDDAPNTERDRDVRPNDFVSGELETNPRDVDFGRREAARADRFTQNDSAIAPVDRRQQISTIADRTVLVPMAQTIPEGTISISNYNFLGNMVTWGASDRLAVTGSLVLPIDGGDLITTLSGKYKLFESRNWIVSVLPFGVVANGTQTLDTNQYGLGTGLLADFHISDSVVLSGGLLGFATLLVSYDRYGGDCTRAEFRSESCDVESDTKAIPAGGHWVAATLGANWFITDSFSVNLEYILGGSWGTFFGVEEANNRNESDVRRARFEDPAFEAGFPHGRGPTISFGGTWSNGRIGFQFATVFLRRQDDPNTFVVDESREFTIVPMLSGAFNF